MIVPDGLAFVIRVADYFDIPSEDSLSLKLSIPGVAVFFLLLEDDVPCSSLVISLESWAKSKSFESRP